MPIAVPELSGPKPVFEIDLTNQGDEPARAVRASVRLGDAEADGPSIPEAAPGQTVHERLELAHAPALPGLYNAVLRLAYTDLNEAPVSAVSLVEVDVGERRGPAVSSTPGAESAPDALFAMPDLVVAPFVRSGLLTLKITPLEEAPLDVTVRLLLPREIATTEPVRALRLEPGKPATLTFALRNDGARPGSRYGVFAVVDGAAAGVHRSVSAVGEIGVGAGPWDGPWSVVAWFSLAALFLAAWGMAQRGWGKGSGFRVQSFRWPVAGWVRKCETSNAQRPTTNAQRGESIFTPLRRWALGVGCWAFIRGFSEEGSGSPDSSCPSPFLNPEPSPRLSFALLFPLLASLFVLWHLSPCDLLRDTTTIGGDTPAHNYLASHLAAQLFGHGRLVSWAGGWWGGFPMFQYYFPLPYLLMALLGTVLPFNVAFKLVAVAGAVLLPFAAFAMGRLMRLARPAPELLALLMVPFLFVDTHTMWGVNLSSTLAGMIANSVSFALMLVALGSAWRDAADGRFRLRTVALLALVMASHFFTSVMTALVVASYPAWQRRGARGRALAVLAGEGGLAVLLMAWWLVPLVATSACSMEYGTNWTLAFWKIFPAYTAVLLALGLVALVAAVRERGGSRVGGRGGAYNN